MINNPFAKITKLNTERIPSNISQSSKRSYIIYAFVKKSNKKKILLNRHTQGEKIARKRESQIK